VNTAINCYRTAGAAALKPAARGKKRGGGRLLREAQERAVQQMIRDQHPEQLKMEFALWNRAAVTQLIEREYGIKLTVRGVGNYLKRWGFTPQKPIRRAYEQSPEAVQAWLDKIYPEIEHRAKLEGAEIHWGDETAVVNTDVRGRCYTPAGKTPVTFAVGGNATSCR
jgi:transposase